MALIHDGPGLPSIAIAAAREVDESLPIFGRVHVFDACAPDMTFDNAVDSRDFFAFLDAFFEERPRADFDHSGAITSADFLSFLGAFFEGCD